MAPIRKRTSIRARSAASTSKSNPSTARIAASHPDPAISTADLSALKLRKQDKRQLKHAALMHKVRDAGVSKASSAGGKAGKRRRPGKKIAAAETWHGLRDALPEVEGEEEWEGLSEGEEEMELNADVGAAKKARRRRGEGDGKIKMRSLKHRPGAMKRRQVLERREQERFKRNLAQLAAGEKGGAVQAADEGGGEGGFGGRIEGEEGRSQKWAALRAFIGGTMERDRAFGKA